jgi:N-acetylglucosamine malate deacetylase 1
LIPAKIDNALRIASIHAHPDDAEILAGGTLALLANAGHEVTIVTLTAGDCGSEEFGPEELAQIRKGEAAAAARIIGAKYVCAGFYDLAIFSDDPSRRRVTGLLRDLRPDIVLTASPADYLCDHEAASQLVRDASFAATIPNYSTAPGSVPLNRIPHLYFMDPIGLADRQGSTVIPDFAVNVSTTFSVKECMLAKHESQRAWLRRQHGIDDYLDQMKRWTEASGTRAGVEYAEGFRQYTVHPYPQSNLLAELLQLYVVALNP